MKCKYNPQLHLQTTADVTKLDVNNPGKSVGEITSPKHALYEVLLYNCLRLLEHPVNRTKQ